MQHRRALRALAAYLFAFSATAVMPACKKGYDAPQPLMKKQSDSEAKQGGCQGENGQIQANGRGTSEHGHFPSPAFTG